MVDNRQVLIHLHTEDVKVPAPELIELGEIAVQHNDSEAALYVKKNSGEISKFIDSSAVESKVNAEKTRAEGVENTLNTAITTEKTRAEGAEEALSDRINSLTGSSHSHDNKAVLDGISAEKVSAWDAAEQNAKDYADGLASNYDAAGAAAGVKSWVEEQEYLTEHQDISNLATKGEVATAEQNAKDYADGLAGNYDAAGAAATAEQNAKDYADGLASNYDAAGAAATAEQNAKDYADGLAGNYDAAGAAATAEQNAKDYANGLAGNYAAKSYESKVDTLVGSDVDKSVRTVAAEEVAKVVASADSSFDTLKEIADWIQNDTTGAAKMANDIKDLQNVNADSRLDALEAISGESHTHSNKAVLDGISAEKVSAWDAAEKNAKDYADGLADNYDAAGAASKALADAKTWVGEQNFLTEHQDISNLATKGEVATAEQNAKDYADGLASNYDAAGAAATAEQNAKNYADGLASNYDAAGAAATAEQNAKNYADGLADNYDAAGAAATAETNANSYTDTKISTLRIDCGTF